MLLALVLLGTLRIYLAVTVGLGVLAWLAYPYVRRQRKRVVVGALLGILATVSVVAVAQSRRLDEVVHELFYRQTVTRMETLGRLYRDPLPTDSIVQAPYRPGAAIALTDPQTGWLLTGLVIDSS